jgi:hypothetical protein
LPSKKRTRYAILMGDIVGSERAPSLKTVHRTFNKAIDAANEAYGANIASPLTITLGDEFQGLLTSLAHAWDVAATLRLKLLVTHVQCRFVISSTTLETPLNPKQAWNMMGAGFSAARDKLNDKGSANAYRFSLPDQPIIESLMNALGDALTQIELEWTPTQLAYFGKVRDTNQTNAEVAKGLGITARSLYKVLHAARAEFHNRLAEILRGALQGLDEKDALR